MNYGSIFYLFLFESQFEPTDRYEGETDLTPLDDLNNMIDQFYDWADGKRIWLGL
jgi:hypothetical protein